WPQASQMLLFLLFFVGGCAGSAGGGIKVIRVRALLTLGKNTITRRLHPNAVITNKVGDSIFTDKILMEIAGFVGMYIATGLIGSIVLALSGADFATAISGSFLCLGNIGIGFGKVGPTGNFAFFPSWTKWFLSFLMLAGRLELFTVYALFSPEFWRERSSWTTGSERNEKSKERSRNLRAPLEE
ncbi:MAG: potassium transporter TrkG, partial [Sphaerochaetaceae bacterium]